MNSDATPSDASDSRYSRQVRFAPLGPLGQRRLEGSQALVVGCGALGSVVANTLVRAGVGRLRLVDRDFVEWSNLQRQVLYTEADAEAGTPKAVAAANHLRRINSRVQIEPIVTDVTHANVESMLAEVDVIVDGSDNFEVRFLINDVSIKHGIPWVYGGCLGADGQTMTIVPGKSACLHCLMLDGPPPPGTTPTCDSQGILGPVINVIASLQSLEAIKLLSGNEAAVSRQLQVFSLWENRMHQVDLDQLRDAVDCPTCRHHRFPWLTGQRGSRSTVLCGRDAVQLRFPDSAGIDLRKLHARLAADGPATINEYLVRFEQDGYQVTIFGDGRAIVSGTSDPAVARKLYSQWLGS